MVKKTKQQKPVQQVFLILTSALAVLLLVLSGLVYWGGKFATDMVHDELSAQNIYFPEKGSPALSPEEFPELQKYAGEKVDNYEEAKAYANGYIGAHLKSIADGKTYAEVSNLALENPEDQALQGQRQSLFMGETLRGVLLSSGYAFGLLGTIALVASGVLFAGAIASAVVAIYLYTRTR